MSTIASLRERLTAVCGGATPSSAEPLVGHPNRARAPADYLEYLRGFGGAAVEVANWHLPPADELRQLEASFRLGGAAAHLLPFAEQDGTWFMAFDLAEGGIVEWSLEDSSATRYASHLVDWLGEQLDEHDAAARGEVEAADQEVRWAGEHIPFSETTLGQRVAARLMDPGATRLRNTLLDLHLQYTFHPWVVGNNNLSFAGLLHFTADAVGCWRCGDMHEHSVAECESCREPLLLGTLAAIGHLQRQAVARRPCFGQWASEYVDIVSPKPTLIAGGLNPGGIPKWGRLKACGGTRDPRVPARPVEGQV